MEIETKISSSDCVHWVWNGKYADVYEAGFLRSLTVQELSKYLQQRQSNVNT